MEGRGSQGRVGVRCTAVRVHVSDTMAFVTCEEAVGTDEAGFGLYATNVSSNHLLHACALCTCVCTLRPAIFNRLLGTPADDCFPRAAQVFEKQKNQWKMVLHQAAVARV
jgi:hypothetical protein